MVVAHLAPVVEWGQAPAAVYPAQRAFQEYPVGEQERGLARVEVRWVPV